MFYVLPDDVAYNGVINELEAGDYVVTSYDGPVTGLNVAHASLIAYAREQGFCNDLPRYEIATLKLLDTEDRYRCTIEMKAVPAQS